MKVAFDISPITSAHGVRGIGSYTKILFEALKKEKDVELVPFEHSAKIPKTDLVHYPYFDLFFHTLPIFGKGKLIITIHDVIPLVFPAYFPAGKKAYINLFLQKLALKRASAVIADSKTSKVDIAEKLSFPPNKIHVVYLAESDIFRQQKPSKSVVRKYNLPEKFILYVGDINWNKNIFGLLQAIKLTNTHLVMVGKAHKDKTEHAIEIQRGIRELKIDKLVTKTGYVPDNDLVSIYNLASLTVLPSFYEGFGLPVLESMACGTPVVCSNNSSLSEIGGKTAIFCNPADPEDIAKKIESTLTLNDNEYKKLQKKCLEYSEKYNYRKVAMQIVDVYKSTLVSPA